MMRLQAKNRLYGEKHMQKSFEKQNQGMNKLNTQRSLEHSKVETKTITIIKKQSTKDKLTEANKAFEPCRSVPNADGSRQTDFDRQRAAKNPINSISLAQLHNKKPSNANLRYTASNSNLHLVYRDSSLGPKPDE